MSEAKSGGSSSGMSKSSSSSSSSLITKPANLECKDLEEYLKSRPPEVLEKLYNYPAICLAVYRELPEIARQFVIRILFVEQPIPQAVVSSWATQVYAKENTSVSQVLLELGVWRSAAYPGGLAAWELCPTFKKNLKIALLGGGRPWSMSNALDPDQKSRDIDFLDTYAMSRWRCVLHYMVGAGSSKGMEGEGISPDAVRILLHANLMKRDETDGSPVITRQGFQFLLLDTQAQVWHFMLQYLDTCEARGLSLPECLSMLFQLSFSTLGRDYSSEGLSAGLLTFLQHLREFGLVYQRKRKEGRFYPTRLAHNITSKNATHATTLAQDQESDATKDKGYIIVETNYRVYAYTDSNLQVALLGLFTELLYRFPNLVVGVLTRDSVRQAFRGGITAEQIISYLEQHAHPTMLNVEQAINSKSPLPPTVVDQIKLWENERNRFTYTEGVVYNQFLSQADFITLRDYAQSISVMIWQNERIRTMVVTKNGHDDVKKFWKRYSKGGS
ncbi:general transcription factor IIH subunit 4 [Anopheles ziemanni]|uniref:general transcription factor IIH subunit 4 n=1 Tax=Anopheles coustani TaxID=139045 RepID=UPI00265832B0|nr:general transcription factor IIH subunit 4 [Anopheles coustani]XP_058172039.1 general transcription factor IIH subunit 4 [Anopheles ziemanni]